MDKTPTLDDLDRKILSLLMKDGEKPYKEIGDQIFVSGGTVHVRMKKMRDMGVVLGAQLQVDYRKLGYTTEAFLGIHLDKSSDYAGVTAALNGILEVVETHQTTGVYAIFAKIICKDLAHFREVLQMKIQQIQGIQRVETFISLDKPICRPIEIADEP